MEMHTELKAVKFALLVLGASLAGACGFTAGADNQEPLLNSPLETSVVATVNALNSETPVPAITLPPVATGQAEPTQQATLRPSPSPTDPWGDFATPSRSSATEIPFS